MNKKSGVASGKTAVTFSRAVRPQLKAPRLMGGHLHSALVLLLCLFFGLRHAPFLQPAVWSVERVAQRRLGNVCEAYSTPPSFRRRPVPARSRQPSSDRCDYPRTSAPCFNCLTSRVTGRNMHYFLVAFSGLTSVLDRHRLTLWQGHNGSHDFGGNLPFHRWITKMLRSLLNGGVQISLRSRHLHC